MSVTVEKLLGKSVIDFIDKVQRYNDDRSIGTNWRPHNWVQFTA